jgi:hypothetical protein
VLRRYNLFIRRHLQILSTITFGLVLALWTASQWFPPLGDWLLQRNAFDVIIIGLLAQALTLLNDLIRPPGIQTAVGQDQYADLDTLKRYVHERRPESADLLEYSSFMVNSLLEDLTRQHATIRLLICDPDAAINKWQTRRIRTCIATLRDVTFKDYPKVTVRCYRVPASVRGREIGQILNIGWYFYGHQLYGVQGTMTMMTVRIDTMEGRILHALFRETFELLWNHPQTRQLDLEAERP